MRHDQQHMVRWITAIAAFLGMMFGGVVLASEGVSPLQPGATTGNPAGALPPKGVYLSVDADYETGKIYNDEGRRAKTPTGKHIKATNVSSVAALTWVTGYKLLGARYAMGIAQPYKWAHTRTSDSTSKQTVNSHGMVNTAFIPVILSWQASPSVFIGTGLTIYANNGKFDSSYDSSAGRQVKDSTTIGNHYWTFEPNFAVTYLNHGWNITVNQILDFNTPNSTTEYRSGQIYYLDLTIAKTIRRMTWGVIANYTQQITNDEIKGKAVEAVPGFYGKGNKMVHQLIGPMVAYDFGRFSINSRFLFSVKAKNDANISFFHIGFSLPLSQRKE
ncbi:MAG: hypothetical protein CENE_02031 [Candidatus Celerinatantimonas neptuna]|nr:MAG: hypothetical protein CENE_02031 [Candidatus Celerinatantimonas neptuna]